MSYSPVAIVTGAARGIGLATTKRFLDAGWHVAMVDRDEPELQVAAAPLQNVMSLPYDVSVPEQVDAMVADTLAQWGQVDALVNNAGVADFGPIEETDFARWRRVMETNLDGVFLCSQAVIPALKASRGAIVNIASISGLQGVDLAGGLRHVEGRRDAPDQAAGGGAG
jgi:meso-butanediol dehydrogenase/(S,S)-butanediol dehydrogenase/diacetyl reductase